MQGSGHSLAAEGAWTTDSMHSCGMGLADRWQGRVGFSSETLGALPGAWEVQTHVNSDVSRVTTTHIGTASVLLYHSAGIQ